MKLASLLLALTAITAGAVQNSPANRTNTQIIDFILKFQEDRIVAVAEAMPAEKYNFAPTAGEFHGVRTFAEQLKHIAADNYLLGAGILGEKPPGDVNHERARLQFSSRRARDRRVCEGVVCLHASSIRGDR